MIKSIRYLAIIGRAKARKSKPGPGFEVHHITPKCCGGSNAKNNLVVLTYQEHYDAHKELALTNPNIEGLQWAWLIMCQRDCAMTAEEFAEAKIRISVISSKNQLGENNSFYGHHHSDERRKIMSEQRLGEKNQFYGHHHSDESKKKMSDSIRRRFAEDEVVQEKLILGRIKTQEAVRKPVMCIETGEIFESESDAMRKTGIDGSCIAKCCRGKRKTCGKRHWRYV